MNLIQKFKPAVKKRTLLYIAGCVWSIGGIMLITRSLIILLKIQHLLPLELISGIIIGVCIYIVLFTKISKKNITRISLMKVDFPCFFSFFNLKGYILMIIMLTSGIILRRTNIIEQEYLYTFCLAMGVPLLLSAFRFFLAAVKNIIEV
jgi:hypothetical protein